MREDADDDQWVTAYDDSALGGGSPTGGNNKGSPSDNKGRDSNDDSNNEYESDQWDDSTESIENQEAIHSATAKNARYTHHNTTHSSF